GGLEIPSDDEIAALSESVSPADQLQAAFRTLQLVVFEDRSAKMGYPAWLIQTPGGRLFLAAASDEFLWLNHVIGDLVAEQFGNPAFFQQLLAWQADPELVPRFVLDGQTLALRAMRS